MKSAAGFLITAVLAAGAVAAQTTSPSTAPSDRSTYPSSSSPSSPSTSSGSYSSSSGNYSSSSSSSGKSHEQQMKDCMAQQQASNPNMSKSEMKKACKNQMHSSTSTNPRG